MKCGILEAKEEIYIFSWLFDFEYKFNKKETFLEILNIKPEQGIKIYVLIQKNVLYLHVKMINSNLFNIKYINSPVLNQLPKIVSYSFYKYYRKIYPNSPYQDINLFKNPCHFHNKLLLIDRKLLLLGGIDTQNTRYPQNIFLHNI